MRRTLLALESDLKIPAPVAHGKSFSSFHRLLTKIKYNYNYAISCNILMNIINIFIYLPILKAYHVALSLRVSRDNVSGDAYGPRDRKNLVYQRMFHYRRCFSGETK